MKSNIPSLYYEYKQTSEMNNVESLSRLIFDNLGFPKSAFSNLEDVLKFLFKNAEKEKLICE